MRWPPVTAGERFGRLIVIRQAPSSRTSRDRRVHCTCDCGKSKDFRLSDLRNGKTRSCGCLSRETASKRCKTHGRSGTPLYQVWGSMVERCSVPTCSAYARYGGRGIHVCKKWLKFENFLSDMGERPEGGVRYTLERKDNNRGYSKSNCKWATHADQSNNRSVNVRIEFDGRTQNLNQWCRELGISMGAMIHRIRAGWGIEEAFTTPSPSPHRVRRKS